MPTAALRLETATDADLRDYYVSGARRRILLVANPTAGGFRGPVLNGIAARLKAAGADVELRLTTRAGEIGEICADFEVNADTIVIAGGDGSLNEALRGLREGAGYPKLAVIPFGTANVLAHEMGLPFRPHAIVDMILKGNTKPLRFGLANGVPFVLMTSVGFDADVVHHLPLNLKRRLGKLAYVWTAAMRLVRPRGGELRIITGCGQVITGRLAVVTNVCFYGGRFVLCPEEHATRDGLHLVVLERDNPLAILRFGFALALNRIAKARGVTSMKVDTATIHATKPSPCQIDGDPFGMTPVTVEAAHESIRFMVP